MSETKRKRHTEEDAERFVKFVAKERRPTWNEVYPELRSTLCGIVEYLNRSNFADKFANKKQNYVIFSDIRRVISHASSMYPEEFINYMNTPGNFHDDDLFGPYQPAILYGACIEVLPSHLMERINPIKKPIVSGAIRSGLLDIATTILAHDPWRLRETYEFDDGSPPYGLIRAALPHQNHVNKEFVSMLIESGASTAGMRGATYNLCMSHPSLLLKLIPDLDEDINNMWISSGSCWRRYSLHELMQWIAYGLNPMRLVTLHCDLSANHGHCDHDFSTEGKVMTHIVAELGYLYPEWLKRKVDSYRHNIEGILEAICNDIRNPLLNDCEHGPETIKILQANRLRQIDKIP